MAGYWDMVRQDPGLPNLGQIFLQAQEAKQRSQLHEIQLAQHKQQAEAAQTDAERQKLLPEAMQAAEAGRPQMLQQIAPDVYRQWVTDREQKQTIESKRIANVQRFVAQGLQGGSIQPAQAEAILRSQGAAMTPTGRVSPAALGDLAGPVETNPEALQGRASAVLGAPEADKLQLDAAGVRTVQDYGVKPNSPDFRAKVGGVRQTMVREDVAKKRAEADANARFGQDPAQKLRGEFQSQQTFKNTQLVAESNSRIQTSADNGAGDLNLLYGYMKILDPGSAVREGEFATAASSGSLGQRMQGYVNRILSGERLPPSVRTQMKKEANNLFSAQRKRFDAVAREYSRLAHQAGVSPQDVVLDPGFDVGAPSELGGASTWATPPTPEELRGGQ